MTPSCQPASLPSCLLSGQAGAILNLARGPAPLRASVDQSGAVFFRQGWQDMAENGTHLTLNETYQGMMQSLERELQRPNLTPKQRQQITSELIKSKKLARRYPTLFGLPEKASETDG